MIKNGSQMMAILPESMNRDTKYYKQIKHLEYINNVKVALLILIT